jgi:hypothetical protein
LLHESLWLSSQKSDSRKARAKGMMLAAPPYAKKLEDLLKWRWQTSYEKQNGIVEIGKEWVYDKENCKILIVHKSDGTDSLILFLRVALASEFWFYSPLFDDMVEMMLNAFPDFWRKMKEKEQNKRNLADFL